MRTLSISSARSQLSSLLDEVSEKQETFLISRKGIPIARLTSIPADPAREEAARYPLRTLAIHIADDFDEPAHGVWEASAKGSSSKPISGFGS